MSVPYKSGSILALSFLFLSGCALTPPPSETDELPSTRYQQGGVYAPYSDYPTGNNTLRSESFSGGNSYVVQPGDNLYRIAKSHGCDYRQLAECNGIHQSRWDGSKPVYDIAPGQRLQLCSPCR